MARNIGNNAGAEEQREVTDVFDQAVGFCEFRSAVEDQRQRQCQCTQEHFGVALCGNGHSTNARQQDIADDFVLECPERGIDQLRHSVAGKYARQRRHPRDQQRRLDDVARRRRIAEILRNRQAGHDRAKHQRRQQDANEECREDTQRPGNRVVAHALAFHQALHHQHTRHDEEHLHAVLAQRVSGPADQWFRVHPPAGEKKAMRDQHRQRHRQPHHAEAVAILLEDVAELGGGEGGQCGEAEHKSLARWIRELCNSGVHVLCHGWCPELIQAGVALPAFHRDSVFADSHTSALGSCSRLVR